jgi:Cellulase (glycosyl hydrolase family 5)
MCRRLPLLPVIGVLLLVAAVAVSGCGGSSSAKKRAAVTGSAVSGPLIGVTFDGPVLVTNVGAQVDQAVASGVESLRVAVDWAQAQPYATAAQVPASQKGQFQMLGGVPTRIGGLDLIMSAAAKRQVSVLPVVEYTPGWDATHPGNHASTPKSAAPYAAFMAALVKRYGPGGTFWSQHPQLPKDPVHMWQVWNEPHFTSYWTTQPFAPSYVALLKAAHDAIKTADPSAKVVLAGLADFSWQYLAQIYRQPNARSLFDIVAIHPYTARPQGVITILQRARQVMDKYGDGGKPILATEVTWPSSEGKAPPQFGVSTTEAQQAQRIAQVMPLLQANRRKLGLMGFYWYTWVGNESPSKHPYGFDFAGLKKFVIGKTTVKPALAVFAQQALRIEGCRSKTIATRCAGG